MAARQAQRRRKQWFGAVLALAGLGALVALPIGNTGLSSASASYYYYNTNPGPPATLALSPAVDTDPVGTTHTVTATVEDANGNAVQGIDVVFTVTGSTTTGGSCTTDSSGTCTFSYSGPTQPGSDTISAFADSDGSGTQDTNEPSATATKSWVAGPPASIALSPVSDADPVGTSHTVTATVTDTFGNAVMGTTVRFSVTGSVTTSGSCVTDVAGQCSFTYAGPAFPGTDTISAYADTNGNASLDTGEPQGTATKTWVLPASTPGEVTGGGQIHDVDPIAFGFTAHKTKRGPKGDCTVVDLATNRKIKCLNVNALVVVGNQATFWGDAKDNGVRTIYMIQVTDNGEPGTGQDTFAIQTASGFDASGVLTSGNIEVN